MTISPKFRWAIAFTVFCATPFVHALSFGQLPRQTFEPPMQAVPAIQELQQPDGSTFQGYFRGTREFSYYTDAHGLPVARIKSGEWQWANLKDGAITPLGVKTVETKSKSEAKSMIENAQKMIVNAEKDAPKLPNGIEIGEAEDNEKSNQPDSGRKFILTIHPENVIEIDGYTILIQNNAMHYAHLDTDGILVPSGQLVGKADPIASGFTQHLRGKKFDLNNPLTDTQKQQLEELKRKREKQSEVEKLQIKQNRRIFPTK